VHILFFLVILISWKSCKKYMVARSFTETEYKTLADGTFEVLWLQYLLSDLQITPFSIPTIWCDNFGATYLSTKPIFHTHTKHVEVDYYFVCDRVTKKAIQIRFISFKDQFVDVFTKSFFTIPFIDLRFKLRVEPPPLAWEDVL
jgi:hypothetical protein